MRNPKVYVREIRAVQNSTDPNYWELQVDKRTGEGIFYCHPSLAAKAVRLLGTRGKVGKAWLKN
jgi:hypothetical protein